MVATEQGGVVVVSDAGGKLTNWLPAADEDGESEPWEGSGT